MYSPRKIYRCPCLCEVANQLNKQQMELNEILTFILRFKFLVTPPPKIIYCCKVGVNKENCFIICERHLELILFSSQRNCRCLNCVKETMRNYFEIFYYNENL